MRLPQSFTLIDVGATSSMRPVAEVQAIVGDGMASTSRDMDAGVTSPLMEAAKALCHSPVFSVSQLTMLGVNIGEILRLASTCCEDGVRASRGEIADEGGEVSSGGETRKPLGLVMIHGRQQLLG